MAIERWTPRRELTRQEESICKHLGRVRRLLVFLRRHRQELFDERAQAELESMYRESGAGKDPVPPGLMAMATLVQDYLGVSDAEMVKLTAIDLSVQMVLDHLGRDGTAFSQGAFSDFRQRFIRFDMDRRLLERTVEIAKRTQEFDWRKLPKTLRVGIDSAPLEGAGRVEDTFNLLAHAARKVVRCATELLGWEEERLCTEAGIPLLLAKSVKAALDIDWSDAGQKDEAIKTLTAQLDSLQRRLLQLFGQLLLQPSLQRVQLRRERLDRLVLLPGIAPINVEGGLDAFGEQQRDPGLGAQSLFFPSQQFRRAADDLPRRVREQVEGVLDATGALQRRRVDAHPERLGQFPPIKLLGALGDLHRPFEKPPVHVKSNEALAEIAERPLRERRAVPAEMVQHHLHAQVDGGQLHHLGVRDPEVVLHQRRHCHQSRRDRVLPRAALAIHRLQFRLSTLVEEFLPVPAEENQRSEEHTSELQSRLHLVCRLLLEKKKKYHTSSALTQNNA